MEGKNIVKRKQLHLNLRWERDQRIDKILNQAVLSGKFRSQNDFVKTLILSYGEKELNEGKNFHTDEAVTELKKSEEIKVEESIINPLLF